MDIDKFLENESKKFKQGIESHFKRRKEWESFRSLSKPYFETVCEKAKTYELFDNLYVMDSKEHEHSKKTLPFITLLWGLHPAGYATIENSQKLGIEKGCALHFSQNIFGMVSCVIYPFSSDFHQPNEKYYIYKMYKKPSDITKHQLDKAIKLMFIFAHNSSFFGSPDIKDKFRIFTIKCLSTIKKIKYSEIIKPIFALLKNIIKKWANPTA